MTTASSDKQELATLAFYISCPDREIRERIKQRLVVDYSAQVPVPSAKPTETGEWFVATNPIYLGEFGNMVRYAPMLQKLFATDKFQPSILPTYVNNHQMIIATPETDPFGVHIGTNAWVKVAAYKNGSRSTTVVDEVFCGTTGCVDVFDAVSTMAELRER